MAQRRRMNVAPLRFGNGPVQWHRFAIFRGTNRAQFSGLWSSANKPNFSSVNNVPAAQAAAFVLERSPQPKGIEPAQRLQFFKIGRYLCDNNAHRFKMTESARDEQSG